jgi:hypothetical protein
LSSLNERYSPRNGFTISTVPADGLEQKGRAAGKFN